MIVELIIDKNCISDGTMREIEKKLAQDFDVKVQRVNSSLISENYKELPINIMPAWVIDGELLQIHPMNYEQLKQIIHQRLNEENSRDY